MKYDISWIMQSFLGDYPGSRSDSNKKFIRAVNSFLDINDPRTQLVIASDGCQITHDLYYKHFKKYENISYVYVDKSTPKMYENSGDANNLTYYRGIPREAGRAIAEGYLIAYMDSDDFLLPNASQIIKSYWNGIVKSNPKKDYKWAVISKWYDNIAFKPQLEKDSLFKIDGEAIKVKGLKSKWICTSLKENGNVLSSTWSAVHRHDSIAKWQDVQSNRDKGEVSEDTVFWRKARKDGDGFIINDGFYVRCHYSNIWDY